MTSSDLTASDWLQAFDSALGAGDIAAALMLFNEDCHWRDLLAFTWNLKTVEGLPGVSALLQGCLQATGPSAWQIDGEARTVAGTTEAWFSFETPAGRGVGCVRLREGRCWSLFTALRELKGFEEKAGRRRWRGTDHHYGPGRKTWLERRTEEAATIGHERQPYCLIVGGGQGGIALAARLRRLEVPTLVIDRLARPGDAWRRRYKSLSLHDPVWYDHLPYLPFPDHWPVFTPKDKLADWLEAYVGLLELDYWSSTECTRAEFDAASQTWEVTVVRDGQALTLRPTQLVFALGVSGYPVVPAFPGMSSFRGVQHHSSAHPGGEAYAGKRCVVIGSNNSAHDICADLWEHGADVTMVQRSSTLVVRSQTLMDCVFDKLYSENALAAGIGTDQADLIQASTPFRQSALNSIEVYRDIARRDAAFYDGLRAAGFMLDFGEDGSGLHTKYVRRGSGYYIDVGASDLIISGQVKLRSGVQVECILPEGVQLSDGSLLPADLIVHATGYGSMNSWVADIVSPEVADRVGKCWGVGSGTQRDPGPWEGELRNMWKPTHQPNLWFHGGNLSQSRHYSLYLALQLKARMERLPTPVWGMPDVHHLR